MAKQFQLCSIPYSKDLGNFFKSKRSHAGITQAELANVLGLKSSQFVSNVERGICAYTIEQLPQVITKCEIERAELIDLMMLEYKAYISQNI